jgi:hypothetical protein
LDDAGENIALEEACNTTKTSWFALEFSGPIKETERWRERSKPSTKESGQCLMTWELIIKFKMDFGQNEHLQYHQI